MTRNRLITTTLRAQALAQIALCFGWIMFTLKWHNKEWHYLMGSLIAAMVTNFYGIFALAYVIRPSGSAAATALVPHVAGRDIYQYYRANPLRAFTYLAIMTLGLFLSFVAAFTNFEESRNASKRDEKEIVIWATVGFVSLGIAYLMEAISAFEVVKHRGPIEQGQSPKRFFTPIIDPATVVLSNTGGTTCCALFIATVLFHKITSHSNLAREILGYAAGACSAITALHYLYWACQPRSAPTAVFSGPETGAAVVAPGPAVSPLVNP